MILNRFDRAKQRPDLARYPPFMRSFNPGKTGLQPRGPRAPRDARASHTVRLRPPKRS